MHTIHSCLSDYQHQQLSTQANKLEYSLNDRQCVVHSAIMSLVLVPTWRISCISVCLSWLSTDKSRNNISHTRLAVAWVISVRLTVTYIIIRNTVRYNIHTSGKQPGSQQTAFNTKQHPKNLHPNFNTWTSSAGCLLLQCLYILSCCFCLTMNRAFVWYLPAFQNQGQCQACSSDACRPTCHKYVVCTYFYNPLIYFLYNMSRVPPVFFCTDIQIFLT